MIFNFARGSVGTKVPLLPHDLVEGLAIPVRPPQRVFLRSFHLRFHEIERNPCQLLRRLKVKFDRLWPRPACAPSRTWLRGGGDPQQDTREPLTSPRLPQVLPHGASLHRPAHPVDALALHACAWIFSL